MRWRGVVAVLVGLLLSGGAIYFVEQRLSTPQPGPVAAEPGLVLVRVVVAAKDLKYGDRLNPELLREAVWPRDSAPEDGFGSVAELLGDGKEERVVLRGMLEGEPLVKGRVTPFAGKATLGYRLEEGKRAVTFRVNDVSGVAGFILPGDKVDIMLTRRIPGQGSVTDMILQNITVLGINQETNEERNKPLPGRTATVEATPEEAQKLSLAQRVGALSLALRNVSATSEVQPQRVVEADLFPPSKQPEEREDTVRVRRGIKVTVERMGL
jgi:pilus assembly protein CpaB